ncbi:MAG: type IX secretion system sortase PorU [Cyclobacteriaceae bacterium]|nr:type IX secretion system sortase PorU [Cyclobacteriaceae bacterium]
MLMLSFTGVAAQESVLRSGNIYKLAVEKTGVYKISYDLLKKIGIDPDKTDPRKIKLYGYGGGMLAQANSAARPADLPETSVYIAGEGDGKFDKSDYILFYAEGPDEVEFNPVKEVFRYEHNLYAEKNFYFITVSEDAGKRVTVRESDSGNFPVVDSFNDFYFHELDTYNELKSGRDWFGEKFDLTTERSFTFDAPGILENTTIKWVSDVMAQSYSGSSFKLFFNNTEVFQQTVLPIPNSRYAVKGADRRDTLAFNANTVAASSRTTQEIKYQYIKSAGRSIGYLDFFLISFKRKLSLYGDQTIFQSSESLQHATTQFKLTQVPSTSFIWDITNPQEPVIQSFFHAAGTSTFSTSTTSLKQFILFNEKIPAPEFIEKVPNQNLHGFNTPNFIIITHPDFLPQATQLANHRQQHNQWTTAVVVVGQIFNEFSSGRQDVSALRDFIKYLRDKNPGALKAVLLFGRGSYDYKNRVSNNTNFVPTYESRNSLHPLQTYSSDDYFGFLENNEGTWAEDPAVNHTMDIGVGRLPVKTALEAITVVNKIIAYDTDKKTMARWRKEITFVADDGNIDDGFSREHQNQSNILADFIEANHPAFDTRKFFMGTYQKETRPSGDVVPQMNKDIVDIFNRGSLIINFTGHGSERVWTDERIFSDFTIPELVNKTYPFLVTATCEFGRQDDPSQISSAELIVTKADGGAIGLVTTARPVNSSTNFGLNSAFYDAVFDREDGQYLTLGEIFRRTKNGSTSGVANRNFSLLADPSLLLAMPQHQAVITEIKTATGSSTLSARSTVIVKGEVQDSEGNILTNFTGILEATLFDKKTDFVTIGKNNPAFQFDQWFNSLFRGKANVKNGTFQFEFILPKNIAYETGPGKLSVYARDASLQVDAAGYALDFVIGQSEVNPAIDNTSPTLALFMGDTTFINGGITSPDTELVVRLKDASGINISSYGIGNDIIAVLDNDGEIFILNDYYQANPNDFTTGYIYYPLKGLPAGKHTITVKAWDTYNNPAEAIIYFVVTDGQGLVIESFGNYPNPTKQETTFFFTHNRSGEDLETTFYLYNSTGQVIQALGATVTESPYRVELLTLDVEIAADKKLTPGLYLARLVVRSLADGSKNEHVTKLIIVN